jgi:hypothetical protein
MLQLPRAGIDPTTRIVSPKLVVTTSSKVTATAEGVVHGGLGVIAGVPGQTVLVAVL